jgi:hypothetical protein
MADVIADHCPCADVEGCAYLLTLRAPSDDLRALCEARRAILARFPGTKLVFGRDWPRGHPHAPARSQDELDRLARSRHPHSR